MGWFDNDKWSFGGYEDECSVWVLDKDLPGLGLAIDSPKKTMIIFTKR